MRISRFVCVFALYLHPSPPPDNLTSRIAQCIIHSSVMVCPAFPDVFAALVVFCHVIWWSAINSAAVGSSSWSGHAREGVSNSQLSVESSNSAWFAISSSDMSCHVAPSPPYNLSCIVSQFIIHSPVMVCPAFPYVQLLLLHLWEVMWL